MITPIRTGTGVTEMDTDDSEEGEEPTLLAPLLGDERGDELGEVIIDGLLLDNPLDAPLLATAELASDDRLDGKLIGEDGDDKPLLGLETIAADGDDTPLLGLETPDDELAGPTDGDALLGPTEDELAGPAS